MIFCHGRTRTNTDKNKSKSFFEPAKHAKDTKENVFIGKSFWRCRNLFGSPRRGVVAGGFTLIEVIVSITILAMVITAVFAFYSNTMNNQEKLKEKYTILRIAREFVDTFIPGWEHSMGTKGSSEKENFILEWQMAPVEDAQDVVYSSGRVPRAQLNIVRLQIIKKETDKPVLELDFLYNVISAK